ncbi:MAG: putative membrane protein [Paraglaciecola sp.]|jgi:uncharacterized membrane protein
MNRRILRIWDSIRTSFWFVPSLMVLLAIIMSQVLLQLDRYVSDNHGEFLSFLYQTSPESARALLTTIAASMITVTSIAFSITVVALSLASSQFGPRLIRNFMMDIGTKCVLGNFVATFIYCLLIIEATKSYGDTAFVPGISLYFAVLLAILGAAVLIYFIHHVAWAIQADNVIDDVYCDLQRNIDRLFPEQRDQGTNPAGKKMVDFEQRYLNHIDLPAGRSGYIQTIDFTRLLALAAKFDIALDVHYIPGDFVCKNISLITVYFQSNALPCNPSTLVDYIIQGGQRTPVQDAEFAVHQLVEIAVRALSPGINDPYSAMTCVDKLTAILTELTTKPFPESHWRDDTGVLRLVCRTISYEGIGEAAFNQIRQYAHGSIAVTIRLLEGLITIVRFSQTEEQRGFVRCQALMIEQTQRQASLADKDWQDINQRLKQIKAQLELKS